jgi:hypothetical protein
MSSEEKNSICLGFVAGYLVDNPPIGLISFWTIYGGGQEVVQGLQLSICFGHSLPSQPGLYSIVV